MTSVFKDDPLYRLLPHDDPRSVHTWPPDVVLRERMTLAGERRRIGYRRLRVLLRREGACGQP